MAFQIKDFVSIVASMLNHVRGTTTRITDLQPGSVARTLVESPAIEIEELYLQMFNGLREAIPVATYRSFGFDKLPAAFARGTVSISTATPRVEDFDIPADTVFTAADGREYRSTKLVVWPAGEYWIRVPVIAAAAGFSFNIAAGSIVASPAFNDTYTISNAIINNGRDPESDAEREARFAAYVGSLSRGTVFAVRTATRDTVLLDEDGNITEFVTRIGLIEISGYVRIFIYTSAGLPSPEILSKAQLLMDGWVDQDTGEINPGYRAGGVRLDVLPMAELPIDLSIKVAMFPGHQLNSEVEQNLDDAFTGLLASVEPGGLLRVFDIKSVLLNVLGVRAVSIDATENILCGMNQVLVPGLITVEAL